MMNRLTDSFTLENGYSIPCLGYGTWQTPDGQTAVTSLKKALETGYRHIDTAAVYGNEVGVGQGIAASGIPRDEIFVTSKVWNSQRGYSRTLDAFAKTLSDLQLDYLDLYLIHWPANERQFKEWDTLNRETWRAMTELYNQGKIRAIGVSNFKPHHLESLMKTEVPPMVNQIEYHPGQLQEKTVRYCREHNILVEAWSPLGTGKMLTNPTLNSIADKYNRSAAQICIRWILQNGLLPLPKSVTPSRIEENARVFDFTLDGEDMKTIGDMEYFGGSGLDPDLVDF